MRFWAAKKYALLRKLDLRQEMGVDGYQMDYLYIEQYQTLSNQLCPHALLDLRPVCIHALLSCFNCVENRLRSGVGWGS